MPMSGRILATRVKDGVTWQARVSADRGRLEVIGIVPASSTPTVIDPLTQAELLELLSDDPQQDEPGPRACSVQIIDGANASKVAGSR